MPTPRQCAECGASLSNDAPDGPCPVCGLRAALKVDPQPAAPFHPSALFEPLEPKSAIGKVRYFGDYELLEEVARGGMGVVYRARQVSLNRTVAVKMILAGQLASAADVQRFRAEAEAAANLQHPNIVAIHEVGEHDGQHYFSMDYVEGRNLAELIAEGRLPASHPAPLPPRGGEGARRAGEGVNASDWPRRAAQYLKIIAEAIHYAHRRGILHRDLKPSNVLIDSHDQPRITDFGLAKRLTNSELETRNPELTLSGQVLGSPNFMPPEQASGKRGQLGSHSDVYSLGAILYHLVTGRPPFLAETLSETLQQVQHSDPIAPRLLNPAVTRDLETICLKCLEKESRQRYATAQALADDLGRFLNSEPVLARPIGRVAKGWRWCRRKPTLAGALAACALVLVSGVAGITWQWHRAEQNAKNEERQRQRAEENATRSEQVSRFLTDMLAGVGPEVALGRDTMILRKILDKTAGRIGKDLTNQPAAEAALRNTIGEVYRALGRYAEAEAMHRRSLELLRNLLGNEHPEVATALNNLASDLESGGKYAEAETLYGRALTLRQKCFGREHRSVANSLNDLALLLLRQGKYAKAEVLLREVLAVRKKLLGSDDVGVANALSNLASALVHQDKNAEAEAMFQEALAIVKKQLGNDHPAVGALLNNLATVVSRQGKYAEAESLHRETLANERKYLGEEHPDVALSLHNLASTLLLQGKFEEGEARLHEALAMQKRLLGQDHPAVADSLSSLAGGLGRQSKYAEAEPLLRESLTIRRNRLGEEHPKLADSIADLARTLNMQGKYSQAEPLYREALALRAKLLGDKHPDVALPMSELATAFYRQKKYAEAEALYRELLQIRHSHLGAEHEDVLGATANLACVLMDWAWAEHSAVPQLQRPKSDMVGNAREAESLLRECLAVLLRGTNANHWRTGDVKSRLGGALLTVAVTDHSLTAEVRQAKLAEAEGLLLEGNERLQRSKSAKPKYKRDALERLVRLYQAWEDSAPDTEKSAQAVAWKDKLQLLDAELAEQPAKQQSE